jgi:hypothetical protein
MACKRCGSGWTTSCGSDSAGCPACSKQYRHQARKEGRFVEPTQAKACEQCGSMFTAVGLQEMKVRVLCRNPQCKKIRDKLTRKESAKRRQEGIYTRQPGRNARRVCRRDGCSDLVKENRYQYCSKACAGADAKELKCDFGGRPLEMRKAAAFASWFVDVWDPQRPRLHKSYKPRPSCQVCGVETNHRRAKCCSYACKKLWRGPRKCSCGRMVENARSCGKVSCEVCKRASRRTHRRLYGCYRRRCRTYGGFFNSGCKPLDVFTRDGFVCHICGKKTHRVFKNDDPLSATVDHHPVPLSKGGDHDWHNVRCACKSCNEQKGNKWDGQARLRLQYA